MKFTSIEPPRKFVASGAGLQVILSDCGRVELAPNEQVTFVVEGGAEYDVTRKEWGFYATPSMNGRLRSFGLRSALVMSSTGKLFLMLVEADREASFLEYIRADRQRLICWLDDDKSVSDLVARFGLESM